MNLGKIVDSERRASQQISLSNIRNFSIIAHIDHGKSTLTDRIIELTSPAKSKQLHEKERITDVLAIEQERGITIKLQPVSFYWKGHLLNLIDTPGHVDFAYEVSRSLKASEGAILLVDVTEGIQAQTISTLLAALEQDLVIIPVLNKVDIGQHLVDERLDQLEKVLGFKKEGVILASGKTGLGVDKILDAVVQRVPSPSGSKIVEKFFGEAHPKDFKISVDGPFSALIFDSFYDQYKGVVAVVRVVSGSVKMGKRLRLLNTQVEFTPTEIGVFKPEPTAVDTLTAGMVGYIATGIKQVKRVTIGDTIADVDLSSLKIVGYQRPNPKVFASIYPENKDDFLDLKESLEKLGLNDASLSISQDYSPLLGQGFKVGFLGMLHLEITKERLKREYNLDTVVTMPSVKYRVKLKNGKIVDVTGAYQMPEPFNIAEVLEPIVRGEIIVPDTYMSAVYQLVKDSRGEVYEANTLYFSSVKNMNYLTLKVRVPYAELIRGFFGNLKAVSHGYASFAYSSEEYRPVEVAKVDILVNKEVIPSLSFIEVPQNARKRALGILKILKQNLEREIVPIPLQAAIGAKIIARETVPAYRKNVTAKLYGGDITRKMKLWNNQKKKKKLRAANVKVRIPSRVYLKIIRQEGEAGR